MSSKASILKVLENRYKAALVKIDVRINEAKKNKNEHKSVQGEKNHSAFNKKAKEIYKSLTKKDYKSYGSTEIISRCHFEDLVDVKSFISNEASIAKEKNVLLEKYNSITEKIHLYGVSPELIAMIESF